MQKLVKLLRGVSRQPVRALVQGGVGLLGWGTQKRWDSSQSAQCHFCPSLWEGKKVAERDLKLRPLLPVDSTWHGPLLPLCYTTLCSLITYLFDFHLSCAFLAPGDRLEKQSKLRLWCRQKVLTSIPSLAV